MSESRKRERERLYNAALAELRRWGGATEVRMRKSNGLRQGKRQMKQKGREK